MLSHIRTALEQMGKDKLPDRSGQSLAFEAMWRGLPRDGLVPQRSSFRPELAAKMLANLVLLEVRLGATTTTRIRLVGGVLRDLVGANVTGLDYLALVPDKDHQSGYLRRCLMHPCASWAASPIEYERGYTGLFEITSFPLAGEEAGQYFSLAYVYEFGSAEPGHASIGGPVEVKPAVARRYIDIGAGIPD
ncbi:MAG: PAS domain-containing protein [Parvibaculum sp.]|uniref:PAS domain-containing protein n=1 Tax=Parvibaculum sp. TaxID=2024848 RepID=UPI00283BDBF9|nr:PAS domain-containing protein [Parvibaculum sp.]MDR3499211.1 PAS domain-containing protein [Parvibaculum sp.]